MKNVRVLRSIWLAVMALCFVFSFPVKAMSQVALTVGNGAGAPGSSGNEVIIRLDNPDDKVQGIQLDICDGDDNLTISGVEGTYRTEGFDFPCTESGNGCARILIFSMGSESIEKGSGPIVIVRYEVKQDAPLKEAKALNLENVVIADENNQPLDVTGITPGEFFIATCKVNIQPSLKTVNSGETIQFSATNTEDCIEEVPQYQWEVESELGSKIDQYGLYTAGENAGDPVTDKVIITDTANYISATAYITVGITTQCRINIQPLSQTVNSGDTIQFTANGAGVCGEDPVYVWEVETEIGSEINQNGLYTVGRNETGSSVTDTVIVSDTANSINATAEITVTAITECRVDINPSQMIVCFGDTIQFSANSTGDCGEDPVYVWEVESGIGSEIDQNGLYTAGQDTAGVDTVNVYDIANGISDFAEITVETDTLTKGTIYRIEPEWILGSQWIATFHYILVSGRNTSFDYASMLSFSPWDDIWYLGNIRISRNEILALIMLNPNPRPGWVDISVITGIGTDDAYTVTGKDMLRIILNE